MESTGRGVLKPLVVGWIVVMSYCLLVAIGPQLVFAGGGGQRAVFVAAAVDAPRAS